MHRLAACIILVILIPVTFMAAAPAATKDTSVSRLPALPDPSDPYLKEMFAKVRAKGGQPLNIHLVQGFAPKLARARLDMAYALRYDVVTPALLREMAILRIGQILNSEYELDQHVPLAKACGVTDAQIAALPNWRASALFDEKQRALLGYTEAVALHGGEVDDATYAAFAKQFSPQEIVEITITIITYYGTGQLTKALKVKVETNGARSAPPKC